MRRLSFFLRKAFWILLTGGATVSVGFLSFVGMYAIAPSFVLCSAAFVLAAGYEAQIHGEGIRGAFVRMFNKNHLAAAVVERFLNNLINLEEAQNKAEARKKAEAETSEEGVEETEEEAHENGLKEGESRLLPGSMPPKQKAEEDSLILDELAKNAFYQDYKKQKIYITALKNRLKFLEKKRRSYLSRIITFFIGDNEQDAIEQQQLHDEMHAKAQELKEAMERLHGMHLFFLKKLRNPVVDHPNQMEEAVAQLVGGVDGQKAEELLSEIERKGMLVRGSWILSLGVGVSAGFATLSAIQSGIVTFTVLSVIPFGAVVVLAALAAMGYTFLIYQAVSDMIQEYTGEWKGFFSRRENETPGMHVLRCILAVVAVGVGILATLATAGTWWKLVKDGAQLVNMVDTAAAALRSITISMLVVPNFLFNAQNSIKSAERIARSDYYSQIFVDAKEKFFHALANENIIRFLNPFRLIEMLISGTAWGILFLGHVISIGVSTDQVEFGSFTVKPEAAAPPGMLNEWLTDLNYLPDEEDGHGHTHKSIVLELLILPVTIVVATLKFFSTCWDYIFSSPRDFNQSLKKMYTVQLPEHIQEPAAPKVEPLSEGWRRQEVIEACDNTVNRLLGKAPDKVKAAQALIEKFASNGTDANLSDSGAKEELEKMAAPLAVHRNSFFHPAMPESHEDVTIAINNYYKRQSVAPAG